MDSPPDARLIHHHRLAVQRRIGSLSLDADLNLSSMWTILFGPSGSGKSSLLRAACGLLGRRGIRLIRRQGGGLDDLVLQDETTFVPAHERGIRWAPQQASLFPHLTVGDNIRFGASVASGAPQRPAIAEIISLFKLEPLLERSPSDLSGGERQRVSLARAFAAPGCRLMLLDEPFNGIDRTLRDELLPQMCVWLRDNGIPVISVTHDVEEALQLRAEVALIREGKVESQGYVAEILSGERERLLRALEQRNAG